MTRLLTLVVLGIAVVSPLCEAKSKRIHVTAHVEKTTFTGDPANPQIGDQRITSVELFDKNGTSVGTGAGSCMIVSNTPLEQCLRTAVFAKGQIIFRGLAPMAQIGAVAQFGILGGTDGFRKARGDVTLDVTSAELIDVTFDLEIDSERTHGEFTAQ